MNFTSMDIHLFANYKSASSFTSCLHAEEMSLVSGGLFNIYAITVGNLLSWNLLHFMKTQPKSKMCESVSFSLNKVLKCSHTGVRYPDFSLLFSMLKNQNSQESLIFEW